jgi:hypothetical protein
MHVPIQCGLVAYEVRQRRCTGRMTPFLALARLRRWKARTGGGKKRALTHPGSRPLPPGERGGGEGRLFTDFAALRLGPLLPHPDPLPEGEGSCGAWPRASFVHRSALDVQDGIFPRLTPREGAHCVPPASCCRPPQKNRGNVSPHPDPLPEGEGRCRACPRSGVVRITALDAQDGIFPRRRGGRRSRAFPRSA